MTAERGTRWFRIAAAGALCVHAALLLAPTGLVGGADLLPHLRLIEEMGREPALRSVYAPGYHVLGALFGDWIGLAAYTRGFAFVSAAALIAAFRSLQRAAGLPDLASVVFAWSPYLFALSWCTPKVEAAGYAVALAALAAMLRRRYLRVGLALAAAFALHTAAALFLGLVGGVVALVRRDRKALAALAVGTLAATPLFAAHLAAGCSAAQSLLFSSGDYLRSGASGIAPGGVLRVLVLASPVALLAAAVGARELWHRHRPLAIASVAIVVLYTNALWLAPFGFGTTLNLLRGLTVLAIPVAFAAGVALASRPRIAAATAVLCVAWGAGAAFLAVPESCFVRSFAAAEIETVTVDRCSFRWHRSPPAREP